MGLGQSSLCLVLASLMELESEESVFNPRWSCCSKYVRDWSDQDKDRHTLIQLHPNHQGDRLHPRRTLVTASTSKVKGTHMRTPGSWSSALMSWSFCWSAPWSLMFVFFPCSDPRFHSSGPVGPSGAVIAMFRRCRC